MGSESGGFLAGLGEFAQIASKAASQFAYGQMQSQAYEANARLAEMDAISAKNAAEARAVQQKKAGRAHLGDVRSNILGSGIALEGSPLLVIEEEARQAELLRLNELYQGEIESTKFRNEASLQRFYGDQAESAAFTKAGSTLLRDGTSLLGGK